MEDTHAPPRELTGFAETIASADPEAPTACRGWTAHDIRAHMTAGTDEVTELVELANNDLPTRPTRSFDEREPVYRALSPAILREREEEALGRFSAAIGVFSERAGASIDFTGRPFTFEQIITHVRSECAIHRWDIAGDDALGRELLAQPDLTHHAVAMLDTLTVLQEYVVTRTAAAGLVGTTVVLRSPGEPDVVMDTATDKAAFRYSTGEGEDGDITLTIPAGSRLLALWGRRPSALDFHLAGDTKLWPGVQRALWPDALSWS